MSSQDQERQELEAKLQEYVGVVQGPAEIGPDPVNEPMIRHWCEVLGDRNPIYTDSEAAKASGHGGVVAPPTMMQAWILRGFEMAEPSQTPDNKQNNLHQLLTDSGYPSVVATNCDQGYTRYLRPGDRVSATTVIESISEQKATALGIGYFINTRTVFRNQNDEEVGWMTFRVLKFKPSAPPPSAEAGASAPAQPSRMRPGKGHDNAWWWDGVDRGELLIQKCSSCGELRHPPRPMCGECQSIGWETVASKGKGTVYSYVVMHHPKIPGYDYPLAVAVIDLDEGTRFVSNIVDCDPGEVQIGMRVEMKMETVDDDWSLPVFRPVS
jgi:uncharacterized OB-fold protein/acyl dehydratase